MDATAFTPDTERNGYDFDYADPLLDNRNRLYLAIAFTKIETGVMGNTAPTSKEATSLLPISNISILEVFEKINPADGFKNYQGRVGIDDTIFKYIVRVGKAENGKVFYDISLEVDDVKVHRANGTSLINKSSTSNNYYTQKNKNVNTTNEKHSRDLSLSKELFDKYGNLRQDAAEYITEEMVADLVGYTLSDPAILETLTGKQRSVFQKFVDRLISIFGDRNLKDAKEYLSDADGDIRAIFKDVAKEADAIAEQFKAALDKSQKAEKKTVEKDDAIRNSVELIKGTTMKYVKADRQVITGKDPKQWAISVEKYINEKIRNNNDVNLLADDGDTLTLTSDTAGKAKYRNEVQRGGGVVDKMSDDEYFVKLVAESHIDEIAEVSKLTPKNASPARDRKNHAFAKDGFTYRTAYFLDFDGKYYKLKLSVGLNGDTKTVYNIGEIKETALPRSSSKAQSTNGAAGTNAVSANNYTQKNGNVNRNSKELFADDRTMTAEAEKNTVEKDGVVRNSLILDWSNGDKTKISNISNITNEQILGLLNDAKKGVIRRDSYIPVRAHTPQNAIDAMANIGKTIEDKPLIMSVSKAQQAMKSEGSSKPKHAKRGHSLSPKKLLEILENLDEATDIIYQSNRVNDKGESLPDNVVFVVEYELDGTESVAIVEFDSSIEEKNIDNSDEESSFHTVVTVFTPDTERNGYEFDYVEQLLENPDNYSIKEEKSTSDEGATGEKAPNTFENEDALFTNSISKAGDNVNRNSKEMFADDRTMTAEAEKKTVAEDGVRSSKDITEEYSYKALVEKPDMKLTVLDSSVPNNRTDIINLAKRNAAKVGKIDKKTNSISVFVEDVGDSVVIGTKGLQHGLRRNSTLQTDSTSFVTLKAGEIIKNSIRINELKPKNGDVKNTYVLIGAAKNSSGNLFIIESVVNKFGNELLSMDVLYSVNAKKENRLSSMLPGIRPPVTDSTISISDLLQYVNKYFPDVLPESVYKHFGHSERPQGELGKSAYSSALKL